MMIECHLLLRLAALLVVLSLTGLQIDAMLVSLHMLQLALGRVILVSAIFP